MSSDNVFDDVSARNILTHKRNDDRGRKSRTEATHGSTSENQDSSSDPGTQHFMKDLLKNSLYTIGTNLVQKMGENFDSMSQALLNKLDERFDAYRDEGPSDVESNDSDEGEDNNFCPPFFI